MKCPPIFLSNFRGSLQNDAFFYIFFENICVYKKKVLILREF